VLSLHQPDYRRADRLLATCDDCKTWYLTTHRAKTLVRLPDIGR
jgi:hypothetical protein